MQTGQPRFTATRWPPWELKAAYLFKTRREVALCFLKSWGFDLWSARASLPSRGHVGHTARLVPLLPAGPRSRPHAVPPAPSPPRRPRAGPGRSLGVSDLETALMD